MQPPPIPDDEAERLEALRRYEVLDTRPERAFDRLARIAATLLDVPVALVTLVDEDRQWFKSRVGFDPTETTRAVSFCAHAILDDAVMVVPDATQDPRFSDNPNVTGPEHVRFYAGAPLRTSDGFRLGTICAFDREPRPDGITPEQRRLLADLADAVVDELELHDAAHRILSLEMELETARERIHALTQSGSEGDQPPN